MSKSTPCARRAIVLVAIAAPLLAGAQARPAATVAPTRPAAAAAPTPQQMEARIRQTMLDLEYIGRYAHIAEATAPATARSTEAAAATARVGNTTAAAPMPTDGGKCGGCGGGTVQPNLKLKPRPGTMESVSAFERALKALQAVHENDVAGRETSLVLAPAAQSAQR
jgi:hypothetical protein